MTDEKEGQDAPKKLVSSFRRTSKAAPMEAYDYLKNLQFEKGIEYLERLLEKEPKYQDAWQLKGLFFSLLNGHEEAIAAYDKALEINPQDQHAKEAKQQAVDDLNRRRANKTT